MKTPVDSARFGQRFRELRAMKQMSRAAVARDCGVSAAYLRTVEAGRRAPRLEVVVNVTLCLKLTESERNELLRLWQGARTKNSPSVGDPMRDSPRESALHLYRRRAEARACAARRAEQMVRTAVNALAALEPVEREALARAVLTLLGVSPLGIGHPDDELVVDAEIVSTSVLDPMVDSDPPVPESNSRSRPARTWAVKRS